MQWLYLPQTQCPEKALLRRSMKCPLSFPKLATSEVAQMSGKVTRLKTEERRGDVLLRHTFPLLHEVIHIWRWRLKDRYYYMTGLRVFNRLARDVSKPQHIEIETLNRCNSACSFCPVNRDEDPRVMRRMEESVFRGIIDELSDWDYRGHLNLFSNNEPFLDKRIYEFAAYASSKLPHAYIQLFTNGTALNVPRVERILPYLSHLLINNYGTSNQLHENVHEVICHLERDAPAFAEKVTVVLRRLVEFKTNRAGSAPNRRNRTTRFKSRCAYPFFQMVIRPDGKVSMCNNDALGQATLGDVVAEGVRGAWENTHRQSAKEAMLGGRRKLTPCAKCDVLNWARPWRISRALTSNNFRRILS